jgi:hypothetical protein
VTKVATPSLDGYRLAATHAYLRAMRGELVKPENMEKGDWDDQSPDEAMNELWYHVAKLLKAVQSRNDREKNNTHGVHGVSVANKAVLEFAADVGNCAMIVADACGALDATEADLESAEEVVVWHPY